MSVPFERRSKPAPPIVQCTSGEIAKKISSESVNVDCGKKNPFSTSTCSPHPENPFFLKRTRMAAAISSGVQLTLSHCKNALVNFNPSAFMVPGSSLHIFSNWRCVGLRLPACPRPATRTPESTGGILPAIGRQRLPASSQRGAIQ